MGSGEEAGEPSPPRLGNAMLIQATATQSNGSSVVGAIRDAAAATGTSFQYLLATAQVESGLNPKAAASGSSARGLFQFIDQTWLTTVKESGTALGYGRYADAITRSSSGRYQVSDPALRREIMALRNDPTANAAMAGAFTQKNAGKLEARIGRDGQRRRTLYGAFPRRRRRQPPDHACRQFAGRQRGGVLPQRRPRQPLDLL